MREQIFEFNLFENLLNQLFKVVCQCRKQIVADKPTYSVVESNKNIPLLSNQEVAVDYYEEDIPMQEDII